MGKKTTKDANAQGVSNIAENQTAIVNVKPQMVVSTTPKTDAPVKEEVKVEDATTPQEPKERKYRGILPTENEAEHYGYKVGDRVSYIVTQGGHRVYGWVTNLRLVSKNGRSCAVVQIDLNQPVSYKRLEVYTTRLTKEDSTPNPFAKKPKEEVAVATAEVKPATAEVKPAISNPVMEALVTSKPIKK
jgi:hypothetical protein